MVHCNDEGVEFVEAHACSENFKNISEYVENGIHERLNDLLLPRPTYPSLKGLNSKRVVNPSFDSPTLLPFKNLFPGSENIHLQRTMDPNIIVKRFLFNKDTIATLKAKIKDRSRRASTVNVVCALILKALFRVDKLRHGRVRNFFIDQAVNIRNRTIQPFPKHSCGNLYTGAQLKLSRPSNSIDDDRELNVGFDDLASLLRDAMDKTIADCASMFSGDEGLDILYRPRMEMLQAIMRSGVEETEIFYFSDCTKFDFSEADFGWGKPIYTSIATIPVNNNIVVLLRDKEGDGIDAWVHLSKEDMVLFEQDEDIVRLADTSKREKIRLLLPKL